MLVNDFKTFFFLIYFFFKDLYNGINQNHFDLNVYDTTYLFLSTVILYHLSTVIIHIDKLKGEILWTTLKH